MIELVCRMYSQNQVQERLREYIQLKGSRKAEKEEKHKSWLRKSQYAILIKVIGSCVADIDM